MRFSNYFSFRQLRSQLLVEVWLPQLLPNLCYIYFLSCCCWHSLTVIFLCSLRSFVLDMINDFSIETISWNIFQIILWSYESYLKPLFELDLSGTTLSGRGMESSAHFLKLAVKVICPVSAPVNTHGRSLLVSVSWGRSFGCRSLTDTSAMVATLVSCYYQIMPDIDN